MGRSSRDFHETTFGLSAWYEETLPAALVSGDSTPASSRASCAGRSALAFRKTARERFGVKRDPVSVRRIRRIGVTAGLGDDSTFGQSAQINLVQISIETVAIARRGLGRISGAGTIG